MKFLLEALLLIMLSACAQDMHIIPASSMKKWHDVILRQPIENNNRIPSFADIENTQNNCNANIFATDKEIWGKEDYWATPKEFINKKAGDCEDSAICKYYTLRKAGFKATDLYLLIGTEKIFMEPHAVLLVKYKGKKFILNNLQKEIIPADQYINKYFTVIYSINELD